MELEIASQNPKTASARPNHALGRCEPCRFAANLLTHTRVPESAPRALQGQTLKMAVLRLPIHPRPYSCSFSPGGAGRSGNPETKARGGSISVRYTVCTVHGSRV